jgi:CheY-like chemotaxis protein
MAKGTVRETVRGFIPPGALEGSQLQRIVTHAMDRVMTEGQREQVVSAALGRAALSTMPETASELTAFVFGPLRETIEEQVGAEEAERTLLSLTPFLKQACRADGAEREPRPSSEPPPQPVTSSAPPVTAGVTPAPAAAVIGTILLVEHDARSRAQLAQQLRTQGYEVFTAPDGHVALAVTMRSRPDLVIAALNLPVVGGRQLMALMRVAFAADAPPVLLLADGETLPEVEGAVAVLARPVELSELLAHVQPVVDGVASRRKR